MNKEVKVLTVARAKGFGFGEEGIMALLMVIGVIQIGCAFGASGSIVKSDARTASVVQMHDGTMLAKR